MGALLCHIKYIYNEEFGLIEVEAEKNVIYYLICY